MNDVFFRKQKKARRPIEAAPICTLTAHSPGARLRPSGYGEASSRAYDYWLLF